ncbi:MAG TPA: hypothetical protein VGO91_03260 [Pyrinomonadaceae bacterium]|nr:hypothetical protein [Pyrinomonadaceae bacterium]
MRKFRNYIVASIALLVFWTIQPGAHVALAQTTGPTLAAAPAVLPSTSALEEVNYDVQIYLMVGSNESGEKANLPQNLGPFVSKLRASLPFNNYRVAATFLNRVKNGGSLQVNGVAGSLFPSSPVPSSPTFYEFTLNDITVDASAAGQQLVQINKFKFTMRVPLATSSVPGPNNTSVPVINYEPTGINTRVSIGEGVPTLVGTMTTGRSDESYIVVVTVRPNTGH